MSHPSPPLPMAPEPGPEDPGDRDLTRSAVSGTEPAPAEGGAARRLWLSATDLVLDVEGSRATARLASRPRLGESVGVRVPPRLVLGMLLAEHDAGAAREASRELKAWLETERPLAGRLQEVCQELPEGGKGALLELVLTVPWLPRPVRTRWGLGSRGWVVIPGSVSERALMAWKLRCRMASGWRAALVRAALVALVVGWGFSIISPLMALDEAAYQLVHRTLERPRPTGTVVNLFLPEPTRPDGMATEDVRTDRRTIARLIEGALAQGAVLVGVDMWLDRPELPGTAELAEVLRENRERVVVGEYPAEVNGDGNPYVLAPAYHAALTAAAPEAGEGGALMPAPIAYAGLIYRTRDRERFRTRLFWRGVPDQQQARWGIADLPILGTELYRRWCGSVIRPSGKKGGCWPTVETWDGMFWLRFPDYERGSEIHLLPAMEGMEAEDVASALNPLGLAGRVVILSSNDSQDQHPVPIYTGSGSATRPSRWSGTLLQAALFETLEREDPLWPLGEWVSWRLTGRSQSFPGKVAVMAWSLLMGALFSLGHVMGPYRTRVALGLTLGSLGLCWLVLSQAGVWLPWVAGIASMGGTWYWLAQRQRKRAGAGTAGLGYLE